MRRIERSKPLNELNQSYDIQKHYKSMDIQTNGLALYNRSVQKIIRARKTKTQGTALSYST